MVRNLPDFFKDPHLIACLPKNEPILLALSGGADSSALLYLLCRLREVYKFPLCAAHVNHGIRTENYGNEALRDEQSCAELCSALGVELFIHHVDVPMLAEREGKSLETAARDARYAFFEEIMLSKGIKILATAHNADDNLETQIFNLCRGCGVSGMCGIPEKRDFNRVGLVVRPILSASKSEILDFCKENNIKYVTDSTNLENDCTRNRIRHNVLPELKSLFSSPERASLRLSRSASEDDEFIRLEAEHFLSCEKGSIDAHRLSALHSSLAKRVIMTAYSRTFPSSSSLEAVHIEDILDFIRASGGKKNGQISLPNKTAAMIRDGRLQFAADEGEAEMLRYEIPLKEGFLQIDGTDFAISVDSQRQSQSLCIGSEAYELYAQAYVKNIDLSLCSASSRREGDLIFDNQMHKKVKKIMCDKKIPSYDRPLLPIIREQGEAIYVPLCAVSDKVKATAADHQYVISIYRKHKSEDF
ncbi:MAG: tRNA lysidine(34) synthetase TilS [Clostridia bacterium]|nr:tRNA lysidine(34) synthetase TilS [Clostridia bacterium]